MKILGMGFPELLSLLPFLALGAAAYALVAVVRSRKVADGGQAQDAERRKHVCRAMAGVLVAVLCIALAGFHVCESCGKVFYGKSYANYYCSTMCPDCARYSTPGILS